MKKIKVLISNNKIKNKVKKIAQQINKDFKNKKLVVVSVLTGSVVFCSDIIRNLDVDFELDFIRVASYRGKKSSGKIKFLCDVVEDIKDKDVLLVEDICDSGRTLSYVKDLFIKRKANSVKICTLINKKVEKFKNIKIDYFGFEIDNEFVVGYGLDYNGKYRGLPYIGVI
ncbi:MAG: hypoxanthine phosphoribosyltransferase [Elusimicrobia bacterium]|nr:hypoxanthine phosphoribosyltransferase [Elusimicrobiota bacterium]